MGARLEHEPLLAAQRDQQPAAHRRRVRDERHVPPLPVHCNLPPTSPRAPARQRGAPAISATEASSCVAVATASIAAHSACTAGLSRSAPHGSATTPSWSRQYSSERSPSSRKVATRKRPPTLPRLRHHCFSSTAASTGGAPSGGARRGAPTARRARARRSRRRRAAGAAAAARARSGGAARSPTPGTACAHASDTMSSGSCGAPLAHALARERERVALRPAHGTTRPSAPAAPTPPTFCSNEQLPGAAISSVLAPPSSPSRQRRRDVAHRAARVERIRKLERHAHREARRARARRPPSRCTRRDRSGNTSRGRRATSAGPKATRPPAGRGPAKQPPARRASGGARGTWRGGARRPRVSSR